MSGRFKDILSRYPEIWVVAVAIASLLACFELSSLDLVISRLVYSSASGSWPLEQVMAVRLLNHYFIDLFTAAGFFIGALVLLRGVLNKANSMSRRIGIFLLLSLALGPGLLVNGIFKSEWGRPRPDALTTFGGVHEYRSPLNPGIGGAPEDGGHGRSFPSGHAAAAFWSTAAFFVARAVFAKRALLVLAVALALGILVGMGRVVAGRHFVSDVLWAGVLVFSVNWLVAYLIVRLPRKPQTGIPGSP